MSMLSGIFSLISPIGAALQSFMISLNAICFAPIAAWLAPLFG